MDKTKVGFMVIEICDDWEQVLSLDTSDGVPPKGVLESRCGGPVFMFQTRQAAREAIDRTEHYRLAFGWDFPCKKNCKIVMLETEVVEDAS